MYDMFGVSFQYKMLCQLFLCYWLVLGLGVSTVESNRDRDHDISTSRDVLFQTDENETLDRDLDKNREILIFRVIETAETWFLNCRENLDCRDVLSQIVAIETFDQDTIQTNQDPYIKFGFLSSSMPAQMALWMSTNWGVNQEIRTSLLSASLPFHVTTVEAA